MFGNAVTEFSQIAIGTYGYTIKVDVGYYKAKKVTSVQAQDTQNTTKDPVTSEITLANLDGQVNDAAIPDIAFNHSGNSVTILFKTAVFPYVLTTRFAMKGYKNPTKIIADTDNGDFPDQDLALVVALAVQKAWEQKKRTVPKSLKEYIVDEKLRITNES